MNSAFSVRFTGQAIAYSRFVPDQPGHRRIAFEFQPQSARRDTKIFDILLMRSPPHFPEHLSVGHDPPGMPGELCQELPFLWCQPDLGAIPTDGTRDKIDLDTADDYLAALLIGRCAPA